MKSPNGVTPDPRSPAVDQVLRHIAEGGPLTNKDLVHRTGLARRTLGRILGRLVEDGRVERLPSLRDARRHYYRVGREG